ncbi:hypothetical protein GF382_00505, partial [Candidatus Falkowbacteria bacterium]|nr:hypothetical protein [Candidatus Falkowbacteria bacterium]
MKKTILLTLFLALLLAGCGQSPAQRAGVDLEAFIGPEEAKAKTEKILNEKYKKPGMEDLTVNKIEDLGTVYKTEVNVPNGTVDTYISKDGEYFFIQGEKTSAEEEVAEEAEQEEKLPENPKQDPLDITKTNKPKVELFVMSHCPYGLQNEKGMLPVVETLGDKIDFELKFVYYVMHGEKEIDEQLTQYCIQEEEPEKLIDYLKCFTETGVSTGCRAKAKIDEDKNSACVA